MHGTYVEACKAESFSHWLSCFDDSGMSGLGYPMLPTYGGGLIRELFNAATQSWC